MLIVAGDGVMSTERGRDWRHVYSGLALGLYLFGDAVRVWCWVRPFVRNEIRRVFI